ncbi:hypothetical protein HDF19_20900 [Mucilaginibacter sp. E4BP6]|uniref:hypothetical protein n=1 Tax=Mucilaginibacter sp. E4BP6 TaxID=2723089 RepID=UPI0015CD0ECD|nr:hypothetical protein [Mucilaginibacter sp. E4BP6]NYE68182.1 hypothetical protein [Mucilaginibacter sp. E4BP6]
METAINTSIVKEDNNWLAIKENQIWVNLMAKLDNQAEHKTLWFLFSLMFQGVLFLPIPAVLMYYYNAPIIVLPITFGLYLANIIVGMGGSGIRTVISFFMFTALVNLIMLALYIL